jgi:hypothetical protein
MKATDLHSAIAVGLILVWCVSSAQVPSIAPTKWLGALPIYLRPTFLRLDLPHSRPELIRQELSDTNTILLLARSAGLPEAELATFQVVPDPHSDRIDLYQVGSDDKALRAIEPRLRTYIAAREEGHTKAFLFAALTNSVAPAQVADPDLRALLLKEPLIPLAWVKKADSGTTTNKAGQIAGISTAVSIIDGRMETTSVTNQPTADEVCRWVSYGVKDGGIEWVYTLNYKQDGELDYIHPSRRDAKESDPKYQTIIKEVEDEVDAEMKRKGTFGKGGSIGEFWYLKQVKLKARGIEWHSPAELNPGTHYD